MSNDVSKQKAVERVGSVLAIANDGDRSMVERVIACDMVFEMMYRLGTAEDTLAISDALGIDKRMLAGWGLAKAFQSIDDTGTFDSTSIAEKSKAIAQVLFPDLARGEVDG